MACRVSAQMLIKSLELDILKHMRAPLWISVAFRVAASGLGWFGAAFIAYAVIAEQTKQPWPPLERFTNTLSSSLTLIGTALTAASIYFYSPNSHKPEFVSRAVTAPVVLCACALGAVWLAMRGGLPLAAVNGFALLGIAGAIFRTQPRPEVNETRPRRRLKTSGTSSAKE